MPKKTLILIAVALLVIGIVAYFLFFKTAPKPIVNTEIKAEPPVKVVVAGNSNNNPVTGGIGSGSGGLLPPVPPPPAVLAKVGEKVVPIRRTQMFNGAGLVIGYTAGGNDNTGFLNVGYFAGQILEVNPTYGSAKVRNYTTPAKIINIFSPNQEFTEYWLRYNDLRKQ